MDLEVLKLTVIELLPLRSELVFVGGATISLHIDEPQHITIRETLDVDCVVKVTHRMGYEKISEKLRKLGFSEDSNSSVLCRFRKNELILDVMPTDLGILGFSNKWYDEGYDRSVHKIVNGIDVRVLALPYLLATKIEAFKGRGDGNFLLSHDIEDIVTLFDGCSGVLETLGSASEELKEYLSHELKTFLQDSNFNSALEGHISSRSNLKKRKEIVIERIESFIRHC